MDVWNGSYSMQGLMFPSCNFNSSLSQVSMSPLTVAAVVLQRLAQAVKRNPCQPRAQRVIKKLQGAAELRRQLGEGRLDKTYITIQWEEHTTVKVQASHWWRQQGMKREMRWPCVQMVVELGLPAELLIDWSKFYPLICTTAS